MTNEARAGLLAIVVGLAACTAQQLRDAGNRALGDVASQAPQLASDGALGAQIEAHFIGIDPNSALHVALAVHGGAVTMSGRVASAATLSKYVDAAKQTRGVRTVAARLTVDASLASQERSVGDVALAAAVRAGLAARTGLDGLHLHVTARNGTVTVSGTARSAASKAAMLDAARNTTGVRTIVDRIEVTR